MENSLSSDVEKSNQLEVNEEKNERQYMRFKEIIENNERKLRELEEMFQKEREIRLQKEREIRILVEREREREIRMLEEREREREREREIRIQKEIEKKREEAKKDVGFDCEGCMRHFGIGKYAKYAKYFPPTPYNGYSIVEGLKAIGENSSFNYRSIIAKRNGIEKYIGSPPQNIHMLNLLKQGILLRP